MCLHRGIQLHNEGHSYWRANFVGRMTESITMVTVINEFYYFAFFLFLQPISPLLVNLISYFWKVYENGTGFTGKCFFLCVHAFIYTYETKQKSEIKIVCLYFTIYYIKLTSFSMRYCASLLKNKLVNVILL